MVIIPTMLGYLLLQKRFNQALIFVAGVLAASLLMTVPLWIADSAWWVDPIANFRRNTQWE